MTSVAISLAARIKRGIIVDMCRYGDIARQLLLGEAVAAEIVGGSLGVARAASSAKRLTEVCCRKGELTILYAARMAVQNDRREIRKKIRQSAELCRQKLCWRRREAPIGRRRNGAMIKISAMAIDFRELKGVIRVIICRENMLIIGVGEAGC